MAAAALEATAAPYVHATDADSPEHRQLLQALLDFAKFMLLFSSIIPISLRVSLDMAKLVYKLQISSDRLLPGLQVRSSTLPEELGGIQYLLTDKTGTLTTNQMTVVAVAYPADASGKLNADAAASLPVWSVAAQ